MSISIGSEPIPPITVSPMAESASASLWDRISSWSANHKAVVYTLAGVLVVSVAGGSYYYYKSSSSPRSPPSSKASPDLESQETIAGPLSDDAAKEKKKKKKHKKKAAAQSVDTASTGTVRTSDLEASAGETLPKLDLETATPVQKKEHADQLKAIGNKAYARKDYQTAIELYTSAIEAYPDTVYFSNRAACYASLSDQEAVIKDTSEALRMDSTYVKALNRRAVAYEHVGRHSDALIDFTASSIMDGFANENAAQAIERLLRKIAESKAKEMLASREGRLPSSSFVSAYLDAFRKMPIPQITNESSDLGDVYLKRACEAIEMRDYKAATENLEIALTKPFSSNELEALALNYSATFKFVRADVEGAMTEIHRSLELDPTLTNSLVKRASMHMETAEKDLTLADFKLAIEINPNDPDIYYHRGQCYFILQDFSAAARDYQKSIEIDSDFVFSHIQLGVAQYKLGSVASSMATFRRCIAKFPQSAEVFNYYGELLLDQGKFEEAIEKFETAIQLERSGEGSVNVMPLINKALAVFQWKKDISQAEELCRKALMRTF